MTASTSDDDSSILPEDWTWGDVGHGALDIVGLVPVFGEAADLANAGWYAAEGNYLDAGLSVISMVPVVGDVIGKGGKLISKGAGKLAGPALDVLKKMDFEAMLKPLANHPDVGSYVDRIASALEKWRNNIIGETPSPSPSGIQPCPIRARGASAAALRQLSPSAAREQLLRLPYEDRLATLRELVEDVKLLDVSTAPNTAVFYSGRVRTADGFISARNMAENALNSGKMTLEKTPGGNFLDQINIYDGILKPDDADAIWTSLSKRYADGASGDVLVYRGEMRPNAVLPHELKTLAAKKADGQVGDIKIIDMNEMFERLGR